MAHRSDPAASRTAPARRRPHRRAEVLRVFTDRTDFVSAQRLHALLSAAGIRVALTTVYRTLWDLEARGRVDTVRDETGERLYRARPDGDHRHYLICRSCGHTSPVDSDLVEEWADRVGRDAGFSAVRHTVELTGVCDGCGTDARESEQGQA